MTRVLTLTAAAALIAATAFAQAPADPRWSPWLGCWTPVQSAAGARVCVVRSGGGVALRTTVDGQPVLEHTIIADGMDRPVTDNDCGGTERAEWSADGQRLFARAQLTCGGSARTVSGLAMMAPDGTWLDVQGMTIDGHDSTRVRRYQRADANVAGVPRAKPLTVEAVAEAAGKVSPQVLEAVLAESRAQFTLNSRSVTALADAGVKPALIDLMIALSYPKKFVVERSGPAAPPSLLLDEDPYLLGWAFGPMIGDPYGWYGRGVYAGLYPAYYFSPFAYGYSGNFYPYVYGPTYSIPAGGGAAGGAVAATGTGRVIDGVGYTRMRPRDDSPAQPATAGTRSTARVGAASASAQGYSSGSSSSSSSSSGSAPAAASSGGDSAPRTAVPR